MADNPAHYHAINKITTRWKAYVDAAREVATRTDAERATVQREQSKREVHNTGVPHSQKGS